MTVRGVILAGGKGTRLGELTRVTNKHLLPVGDLPMVCHPLRKMVGAGVREILLVSSPDHLGAFAALLGSGSSHGCEVSFRAQDEPGGIAQALAVAEAFCRDATHCLVVLGDNIFYEPLDELLDTAQAEPDSAWILLKRVEDPGRYGVAQLDNGRVVGLEEKPQCPRSDRAVTGIYLYPPDVFATIRQTRPGPRGEWEITEVNRRYLDRGRLRHRELTGYWTDAGTPQSLLAANRLVTATSPLY